MGGSQRATVLCLYKSLLRESSKFVDYNYREYAMRRVKDNFRENMVTAMSVEKLIKQGQDSLQMLKRQTAIDNMYHSTSARHVMENIQINSSNQKE